MYDISYSEVVSFLNQINTLFDASYSVTSSCGCKWSNARSLTAALNENHYDDVVDLTHIDAFITCLDQLRRVGNAETPERVVYRETMAMIINEFLLLRPLPPSNNRLLPRYLDKLIRSNNKEVSEFINNNKTLSSSKLLSFVDHHINDINVYWLNSSRFDSNIFK